MAASPTATGAPSLCYSVSLNRQSKPTTRKAMGIAKFVIENPIHFSITTARRSFPIRAVDPQREEAKENPSNNSKSAAFTYQEDLEYLWKLVASSVLGAAVVKYGSVVFPDNQTQYCTGSDHDNHSRHCSCFSSDQAKSCRETELEPSLGNHCNISFNYIYS